MKNFLILCLLTLALSGCRVDAWEINRSYEMCKDHGGVDNYDAVHDIVTCADGFYVSVTPGDRR